MKLSSSIFFLFVSSINFLFAADKSGFSIYSPTRITSIGTQKLICNTIIQTLSLNFLQPQSNLKIWLAEETYKSRESDDPIYDLILDQLAEGILDARLPYREEFGIETYDQLSRLRFAHRHKDPQSSMVEETAVLATRAMIAERTDTIVKLGHPMGLHQRPDYWAWNWTIGEKINFHEALPMATERDSFVRQVDASDVPKIIQSQFKRFDIYREILGLPHSSKGRSIDTGISNDQMRLTLLPGKWHLVLDPNMKDPNPIGWMVAIDYKTTYRARHHEDSEERRYLMHFDLRGNRIETFESKPAPEFLGRPLP